MTADAARRTPIVILGGTFDPPHVGHLVLAECAADQFGAHVLFMPAGDPWRKTERSVSPAAHRLAMTELATGGNPRFTVDAREVNREGPTYTMDTLDQLRAAGHEHIVLLLGADALADMPNWKEPERIRELATLAVACRDDEPPPEEPGVVAVRMPGIDVSSTLVRRRVADGLSVRYLVPETVREYIRVTGLYQRR